MVSSAKLKCIFIYHPREKNVVIEERFSHDIHQINCQETRGHEMKEGTRRQKAFLTDEQVKKKLTGR